MRLISILAILGDWYAVRGLERVEGIMSNLAIAGACLSVFCVCGFVWGLHSFMICYLSFSEVSGLCIIDHRSVYFTYDCAIVF